MNRRQALGLASARSAQTPMPPSAAAPMISINGARLRYAEAGPADGPLMIVLHGGRGQGDHRGVFAAHLPLADTVRLISYDMRGHGQSSVTGPFTFDQLVDDLEQLRLKLGGGKRMILQGGSFGGMIALSYAVKYPQGLSHLILAGTAPSWRHETEAMGNFEARRVARAPTATRAMMEKIFSPTITDDAEFRLMMFALRPLYAPETQKPDYDQLMERARTAVYRAKVHNDLYEPATWRTYDLVDRLNQITVPTLVICGASDWICDPAQSRLMASKIPTSRLVVVPGVDHSVPSADLVRETRSLLASTGLERRTEQAGS